MLMRPRAWLFLVVVLAVPRLTEEKAAFHLMTVLMQWLLQRDSSLKPPRKIDKPMQQQGRCLAC